MWKNTSIIILLLVVVTYSADTDKTVEEILNGIEENFDWSKFENDNSTTVNNTKDCELLNSSAEAQCVKKSLCNATTPTDDPLTKFVIRSSLRKKRDDRDAKGQCGWMEVCCPTSDIITPITKAPMTYLEAGCGYGNPGALRSVDDRATSAQYGDFPWMVALMIKSNKPNPTFTDEYIGGGSIIHPTVVMTVAHKVAKIRVASELKCRAGEWDWTINRKQLLYPYQERDVARNGIIVHEQFDSVHLYYDIALLKLKSAFKFENAPHIGVACLEKKLPPVGTVCYSMGWGKDTNNKEVNAKILKKITLPLVSKDECERKFRPKLSSKYNLHKTLTCAGGEADVDTCIGDGGSPLVCGIPDKQNPRYSIVGMVVYGLGCGLPDIPGAYTKIPELYDWVEKKMKMDFKINDNIYEY